MLVIMQDNLDNSTDKAQNLTPKKTVSHFPVIPYINGDGIGRDVVNCARRVCDAAVASAYAGLRKIEWKEIHAGQSAIEKFGEGVLLPDETLKEIEKHSFAIKGPLTTPVAKGIRSLNVLLRKELDLYACIRPVRYYSGVPSVVRRPEKVNVVIFRENTEDIYSGIEFMAGEKNTIDLLNFIQDKYPNAKYRFPSSTSVGIKLISEQASKRLIRLAINHAIDYDLPSVTLVHKGNIMKFTEGQFAEWGYELAKVEYDSQWDDDVKSFFIINPKTQNKIYINDYITDAFFQQILLTPERFSVIATMNLNGDYLSDAVAAQIGGIGIAPGANVNLQTHLYEATHGSAPKYTDLNIANPSSMILSCAMMLSDMGWDEAHTCLISGIEGTLSASQFTADLARQLHPPIKPLSTSAYGDAIIECMDA